MNAPEGSSTASPRSRRRSSSVISAESRSIAAAAIRSAAVRRSSSLAKASRRAISSSASRRTLSASSIRLPDQAGPGFLPLGQAAGADVRELAVELRHALVDLGLQARRFLPLLAALDDPILDRLLPAAEGLRHRPGDEVDENPEEGRQVGELPDPQRQSQERLRGLGRLGEEEGRETHQAHAASLRPRTFSARVRARSADLPRQFLGGAPRLRRDLAAGAFERRRRRRVRLGEFLFQMRPSLRTQSFALLQGLAAGAGELLLDVRDRVGKALEALGVDPRGSPLFRFARLQDRGEGKKEELPQDRVGDQEGKDDVDERDVGSFDHGS